jgi:hypothetical protein
MTRATNWNKVQRGEQPDGFKPMPVVGKGVEEIRVTDESGACRASMCPARRGGLRVARLPEEDPSDVAARYRETKLCPHNDWASFLEAATTKNSYWPGFARPRGRASPWGSSSS